MQNKNDQPSMVQASKISSHSSGYESSNTTRTKIAGSDNLGKAAALHALGTIQVLRHLKRGVWGQIMAIFEDLQYCKSSKRWVGGPKKVKNMMT